MHELWLPAAVTELHEPARQEMQVDDEVAPIDEDQVPGSQDWQSYGSMTPCTLDHVPGGHCTQNPAALGGLK